jgi:hypothetical protein
MVVAYGDEFWWKPFLLTLTMLPLLLPKGVVWAKDMSALLHILQPENPSGVVVDDIELLP